MEPLDWDQLEKVYFVGIGGIGMSALARYMNRRGKTVAGYDRVETPLTRKLVAEGMQIHYEDRIESIPFRPDLVVYTPAVPGTHQELSYLRSEGLPVLKRAAILGLISRHSRTLAIAGTHGKTTTSSLLTYLLRQGGVSCSAFLGGIVQDFDSNYVHGTDDWVVVEADEYDRSFLHLRPEMAAILSTEPDHLDIYGDAETMVEEGFLAFGRQVKQLLVRYDLLDQFQSLPDAQGFGVEGGQYAAQNLRVQQGRVYFDLVTPTGTLPGLELSLPGRHNVENATAAAAIALQVGVRPEDLRKGLASFRGVKRRFERIVELEHCTFIDDYAHHPTELKAAIQAARWLYPGRKLTGIFQPHLFSRTRDFADGFAEALDLLDEALLLEIYPAREEPLPGVNSELILRKMKNKKSRLIDRLEIETYLEEYPPEVLLTMGAGDIDQLVEPLGAWIKKNMNNE
jgi:UDP-N-acetylmuramate--alanine ligase